MALMIIRARLMAGQKVTIHAMTRAQLRELLAVVKEIAA